MLLKVVGLLTNVNEKTALKILAWMQFQRYWVEHAFENAKSECSIYWKDRDLFGYPIEFPAMQII